MKSWFQVKINFSMKFLILNNGGSPHQNFLLVYKESFLIHDFTNKCQMCVFNYLMYVFVYFCRETGEIEIIQISQSKT